MDNQQAYTRRRFMLLLCGSVPLSFVAAQPVEIGLPAEPAEMSARQIVSALEAILHERQRFDYYLYNELRHYSLMFDEGLSRQHSDIILRFHPMDTYILNTISDWHLTDLVGPRDPDRAIDVLLHNAETYRHLPYLRAACLLAAGQTYAAEGYDDLAQQTCLQVIYEWESGAMPESAAPYYSLARVLSAV
jgi:hypothetical protein